jgi:predicted Zn-dependent protease
VRRGRLTRFASPVAFLAAVTIGVLVVRAGFESGRHPATARATTVARTTTSKQHHRRRRLRSYTVRPGDTLGSIASKTGTSVARLEQLNPGIDPTALRIGQTIRVQ